MAIKNHTTVCSTATTYFPIAGSMFCTRKQFSSYVIENITAGTVATYTSPSAFKWTLDVLQSAAKPVVARWRAAAMLLYIVANRKPEPPTPTAPAALRLVQTTSVHAVSNSKREHTMNLKPSQTVGEWYFLGYFGIAEAIGLFEKKYGVKPTLVKVNPATSTDGVDGIAFEKLNIVPERKVHLSYTPAVAA
jgi:hypothetical protein